jgi:hypothetical protein
MANQISEYARERIEQGLPLVPQHMHGGIRRYFYEGIGPGSFLTAVLENNLMEALGRADDENRNALPAYGTFLYNYVPAGSFGSPAKVAEWLRSFATAETEEA